MLPTLQVREDAVRGRGLFATSPIEADTVVLRDEPIAVASMDAPRMTCEVCKRFVGSIQLHLHVLAEHVKPAVEETDPAKPSSAITLLPTMEDEPSLPNLPSPVVHAYVTQYPTAATPSIVCSQTCSDVVHAQAKHIFGPSLVESIAEAASPWVDSDHMILVAALMATVLYRVSRQTKLDWDDAVRDILHLCVAPPTTSKTFQHGNLKQSAFRAVLAAFEPTTPTRSHDYFKAHMTLDMCQHFVAIVQANAVGVQVPSPLSRYFASCEDNPATKQTLVMHASTLVEAALQVLCEDDQDHSDDDEEQGSSGDESAGDETTDQVDGSEEDGETIQFEWRRGDVATSTNGSLRFSSSALPDLGGLALFPRFSMLNHSCDPSGALAYLGDSPQISVFALKALAPGDEVTIAYIDTNMSFESRQAELQARYGFTCTCSRCALDNMHRTNKKNAKISKPKRQRVA
ncbi:hypothetical protein DYB38_011304 [Aphanomyces astaci]|uniref:SET domain-containing protein n=1 Tax=Aphanomyces astaci TaxID=112090 RepID=A0A397C4A5_APHAT|nr:hypothetical protein DYB38_011304 [Aphanomyces astaci]